MDADTKVLVSVYEKLQSAQAEEYMGKADEATEVLGFQGSWLSKLTLEELALLQQQVANQLVRAARG